MSMQDIFLCLSRVRERVASCSARLCSLYHRLVTTARARELEDPKPTEVRGEWEEAAGGEGLPPRTTAVARDMAGGRGVAA